MARQRADNVFPFENCKRPVRQGNAIETAGGGRQQETIWEIPGWILWTQTYPCPPNTRHGAAHPEIIKGPLASPALDPQTGLLYTLSCDGDLRCWNTRDGGRPVWAVNLYNQFKVPPLKPEDNGCVPSPLVWHDWLIVEVGAAGGTLAALDKKTGALKWASRFQDGAGVGSPVPMTVDGVPCVAAVTRSHFLVARLDAGHEGETFVEYPWPSQWAENIPSPIVSDRRVFLTMCESSGRRTALLEMGAALPNHYKEIYKTTDFFTCTSTAALFEGHLYFRSGKKVKCVELATGKASWASGDDFVENHGMGAEVGNLVVAAGDRKLIIWDGLNRGDLVLAEAAPAGPYKELVRIKGVATRGACYPHLVLGCGKILCRTTAGDLVCLSVGTSAPAKQPAGAAPAKSAPADPAENR